MGKGNLGGGAGLMSARVISGPILFETSQATLPITPRPPKLKQLAEWISELIMIRLKIEPEPFKPSVAEMAFHKMTETFDPYLEGDDFPTDLESCPRITKSFIQNTIKRALG